MTVLDPSHLQYLEKTKGEAYENIKRGSKVALVAADVPSHTAVRVLATAEVHEDDDYAKKVLAKTEFPNAFVVNLTSKKYLHKNLIKIAIKLGHFPQLFCLKISCHIKKLMIF